MKVDGRTSQRASIIDDTTYLPYYHVDKLSLLRILVKRLNPCSTSHVPYNMDTTQNSTTTGCMFCHGPIPSLVLKRRGKFCCAKHATQYHNLDKKWVSKKEWEKLVLIKTELTRFLSTYRSKDWDDLNLQQLAMDRLDELVNEK